MFGSVLDLWLCNLWFLATQAVSGVGSLLWVGPQMGTVTAWLRPQNSVPPLPQRI